MTNRCGSDHENDIRVIPTLCSQSPCLPQLKAVSRKLVEARFVLQKQMLQSLRRCFLMAVSLQRGLSGISCACWALGLLALSCSSSGGADSICEDPKTSEASICVDRVTGSVLDADNVPMKELEVTVCGAICFRDFTDHEGRFEVSVHSYLEPSEYQIQPHGTPHFSTFYYQLPLRSSESELAVGELRVIPLPSDGGVLVTKTDLDVQETSPAQTVASGPMTLELGEGTTVRLQLRDASAEEEGRRFRARELSESEREHFPVPGLETARIFALGPFEALFQGDEGEPQVKLSIENTADWEPDSSVVVSALGTYLDPDWLPPGEFSPLGEGIVSSDGKSIEYERRDLDPGLLYLTWIAIEPVMR